MKPMLSGADYRETVDYLFGLQMVGIKLGLDNIRHLLDVLGDPHRTYPVVHVAGTNGKGSTASFIASILKEAGYKTGLYTSPHLVDFSERIRVDGIPVPEEYVIQCAHDIRSVIEERNMTFFEATTAIAFNYFADCDVDIAVIETGLGGRLDATNIVSPAVTVVTGIAVEHTEFLGNTIAEIAAEKGGIIKDGIPLVTAVGQTEAKEVLQRISAEKNAEYISIQEQFPPPIYNDLNNMTAEIEGGRYRIELIGEHQTRNAALAIKTAGILQTQGFTAISQDAIRVGLMHVRRNSGLAGRLLRLESSPELVVDVAHNPDAIEVLLKTWTAVRRTEDTALVLGLMKTKDAGGVFELLSAYAWRAVIIVQARAHGASATTELVDAAAKYGIQATGAGSVFESVVHAKRLCEGGKSVLLCGSHYVVGEYIEDCKGQRTIS